MCFLAVSAASYCAYTLADSCSAGLCTSGVLCDRNMVFMFSFFTPCNFVSVVTTYTPDHPIRFWQRHLTNIFTCCHVLLYYALFLILSCVLTVFFQIKQCQLINEINPTFYCFNNVISLTYVFYLIFGFGL